jgi:tRNA A37 N6-isopentenylltransferase MiaA
MAIDKANARAALMNVIKDWTEDFHTLDSYQVSRVVEVAKSCGYRPPKARNGSPARYFYQFLQRK